MPIDNPQLVLEGLPAWRIVDKTGVPVVEPFYGQPKEGDIAVTTVSAWRYLGNDDWLRTDSTGARYVCAMLRFWLAAKAGWDNEKNLLKNKIVVLEELIEGTAIPKLRQRGDNGTANYLAENLETVRET